MKIDVRQLSNQSTLSWAIYPIFEGRCLRFLEKHQIDFDPYLFRQMLRGRFFNEIEDQQSLVVFMDQQGTVIGHFLAWLDASFGRPYIHVNQLEVEEGFTLADVREEMFEGVDRWVDRLNKGLPAGAPHVDTCQFWTWRDPEVFARYLRVGCDLKISRYVLEYSSKERQARQHREGLH